jgi:hypothetical protein
MKSAFLILAGGILFTGVFLSGAICGGWLVYEAEKVEKEKAKKPEAIRYTDRYTVDSDIPKETDKA